MHPKIESNFAEVRQNCQKLKEKLRLDYSQSLKMFILLHSLRTAEQELGCAFKSCSQRWSWDTMPGVLTLKLEQMCQVHYPEVSLEKRALNFWLPTYPVLRGTLFLELSNNPEFCVSPALQFLNPRAHSRVSIFNSPQAKENAIAL